MRLHNKPHEFTPLWLYTNSSLRLHDPLLDTALLDMAMFPSLLVLLTHPAWMQAGYKFSLD